MKLLSADPTRLIIKPSPLGIVEASGFTAEHIEKHSIFFTLIINHGILMSVQPTCDHGNEELELWIHRSTFNLRNAFEINDNNGRLNKLAPQELTGLPFSHPGDSPG